MTGQRYVIIDSRVRRFNVEAEYVEVLPEGTDLESARLRLDYHWNHLTEKEQRNALIELAYLAVDGEDPIIEDTFLKSHGFDTLSDYTPLDKRYLDD